MIFARRYIALGLIMISGAAAVQAAGLDTEASAVHTGLTVRSADGRMIGQIDRVETGSASVILGDRYVHIPASTISVSAKGAVTSLSMADVRKLN